MVIREAMELFKEHLKGTVKKSTLKSYGKFLDHFRARLSTSEVVSISEIDLSLNSKPDALSESARFLI
jgi:hypothetical protein